MWQKRLLGELAYVAYVSIRRGSVAYVSIRRGRAWQRLHLGKATAMQEYE